MRLKLPYIGFGGTLVIVELIVIGAVGLLGMALSSCNDWWVIVGCTESILWFSLWCCCAVYLLWRVFIHGHRPHEETLQAPRQSVQNPQHFR